MEGSREFLQSLGFTSVMLPVEGQGKSTIEIRSSHFIFVV